jgi:hypothetical protein
MVIQDPAGQTNKAFAAVCDAFSVRQNTPYTFSANLNIGFGSGGVVPANGEWFFRVLWYKSTATDFSRFSADLLSFVDVVNASTAAGAQAPSQTLTAPSNSGYCRIALYHFSNGTTVTAGWNLVVSNVRCVAPLDPSDLGQVLAKGGIPPTLSNGFTYTSTTTSINFSWSGLTVFRADGSTTAIANGNQNITGLSASHSYLIYPYFDDTAGVIGFVTGGVGSPAILFSSSTNGQAQSQNLLNRIPLSNGPITVTTPASGSGGGSGGGSGTCLRNDMIVETQDRGEVRITDVIVGEHLACPEGWTKVTNKTIRPQSFFVEIETSSSGKIVTTPTHTLTLGDDSEKAAADLTLTDRLKTRGGIDAIVNLRLIREDALKVLVECSPGHRFYAGADKAEILAHNVQPAC